MALPESRASNVSLVETKQMLLTQSQLGRIDYEINTLGFSIVEDVIDSDSVFAMRSALIKAIETDSERWENRPQKRYDLIDNLVVHGGVFLRLLDNSIMHQVFSNFLSPTCILYNYGSTFILPKGNPGAMQIHVDSPRLIPNYHAGLIMTLALDNFTEENGATRYLAGSQKLEQVPDSATFDRYSQSVARKAGAAVFFNPRCFHRAMPNISDEIRCGVTVYAVRSFMKQRFDFPRMLKPEVLSSLTAKAKQFIGFDVRVPSCMDEYYVSEADRLYKGGQG